MVPPPSDPTNQMLRSIRRMMRAVRVRSRRLRCETGLTVPQLLCLRALADREHPPTLAELARDVELSPATVTGLADRLERDGLVRRERSQTDRRKIRLAGGARAVAARRRGPADGGPWC